MTEWNPGRVATFDFVKYHDSGVERTLTFAAFFDLPIDGRVKVLLVGKPRFFKGLVQISKTQALARQG